MFCNFYVISSILSRMWTLTIKTPSLLFMVEIVVLNTNSYLVSKIIVSNKSTHFFLYIYILWRQGNICLLHLLLYMQDIEHGLPIITWLKSFDVWNDLWLESFFRSLLKLFYTILHINVFNKNNSNKSEHAQKDKFILNYHFLNLSKHYYRHFRQLGMVSHTWNSDLDRLRQEDYL